MRGFVIVLDSFGVGAAPDAAKFGDEGASTIKTIYKSKYFSAENMKKMGLLAIDGIDLDGKDNHTAAFARMRELSAGKDTTIGHWEMAGIVSKNQLPTFPNGFPIEVINEFEKQTGRKVIVNRPYSGTQVIKDYGEEPFAWQIAGRIVEARETAPIETTLQLADIVASAMPPAERRKNKNPSRRTFQALRIAVNHELDALEEGLDTIFAHLAPGGRLCVITFHSLEDRLVKNKFRRWSTACTCPPEFPVCVCGGKAKAKLITRKPIEANTQELEENRRSRSAHLRVLEKI